MDPAECDAHRKAHATASQPGQVFSPPIPLIDPATDELSLVASPDQSLICGSHGRGLSAPPSLSPMKLDIKLLSTHESLRLTSPKKASKPLAPHQLHRHSPLNPLATPFDPSSSPTQPPVSSPPLSFSSPDWITLDPPTSQDDRLSIHGGSPLGNRSNTPDTIHQPSPTIPSQFTIPTQPPTFYSNTGNTTQAHHPSISTTSSEKSLPLPPITDDQSPQLTPPTTTTSQQLFNDRCTILETIRPKLANLRRMLQDGDETPTTTQTSPPQPLTTPSSPSNSPSHASNSTSPSDNPSPAVTAMGRYIEINHSIFTDTDSHTIIEVAPPLPVSQQTHPHYPSVTTDPPQRHNRPTPTKTSARQRNSTG
ncbi:mucin-2-like [Xenia sp. Carnegie-2017]|uniref:mucin-2-like n=1 Tax=Xenia sp. Carnegie-2017 TaxID=2897299 RepID=UPI001F04A081|nr:mucin-2-like [Xenia sp. Carnegie-2017]